MMTTLDPFKQASVMVVGDVMLDTYLFGRVDRISPEAPVPVVDLDRTNTIPGGAANVAANVFGLGARPYLIGAIGADAESDTLRKLLSRDGLSVDGLVQSEQTHTTHKMRVIAHGQQVVRVDRDQRENLSEHDHAKIAACVEAAMPDITAVIVSDYAKGLLSPDFVAWLISSARAANKIVCVDPKGRDYLRYANATVLTPNRREAAEACHLPFDEPDLVNIAGTRLLTDTACEAVLITEGEHGMTVFEKGASPFHFEASGQEVYDVTGAGDTVIATLATGMASGLSIRQAAEIANVAAGIVVQQVGTTAITSEALERELNGRR